MDVNYVTLLVLRLVILIHMKGHVIFRLEAFLFFLSVDYYLHSSPPATSHREKAAP
jgi:hypothetical protein